MIPFNPILVADIGQHTRTYNIGLQENLRIYLLQTLFQHIINKVAANKFSTACCYDNHLTIPIYKLIITINKKQPSHISPAEHRLNTSQQSIPINI